MDKNRKTAFLALRDMETKDSYSNLALNHYINEEKPDSPAFVRELTYGVLERKLLLDFMARQLLTNPRARLKPADRVVIRMGLYQLMYMDSVPEYAAVDGCVRLAKFFCKGRDGFINGVLRGYIKRKDELELPQELSVKYSYAPWIAELWTSQFGAETAEALMAAGNQRPSLTIRANELLGTAEELCRKLQEEGFAAEASGAVPQSLRVSGGQLLDTELYRQGYFSVQDESSMMAVLALDPKPGDTVVDVCAAPGGKSLFCAERMRNTGRIYSRDIYDAKLRQISSEAQRLRIDIIETKMFNGEETDGTLRGVADRVLVDAPCSGLGVLRRKPEIKYKELEASDEPLPKKQLRILESSAAYVKKGGILVYSTCTINRLENEMVAAAFLEKNKAFELEEQRQILPLDGDLDGFFISRMKRIE